MKIRRNSSTTCITSKVVAIIFIAAVGLIASLNLAQSSYIYDGLPHDHLSAKQAEDGETTPLDNHQGIVEHTFSQEYIEAEDASRRGVGVEVIEEGADEGPVKVLGKQVDELPQKSEMDGVSDRKYKPGIEDKYHVVVSVGEGVYTEWQVRVVSKHIKLLKYEIYWVHGQ